MSFTFQQLETFITAAQCGSFSGAARKMNKAQSAVSTTIGNLEIELGLELFDRTTKSPTLTIHGKTILEAAESMLRQKQSIEELANTLNSGLESRLAVFVDEMVPFSLLTNALIALDNRYPQLKVNLVRSSGKNCLQCVKDGQVDLGLTLASPNYSPDIAFRRLGDVSLANVAPKGHPLAELATVSFTQLHSYRQLIYAPHLDLLPTGEYLQSSRYWSLGSYALILKLLKQGFGWATCPKHLVKNQLASGELIELDLEAYPVTEWLVGLDMVWSTSTKNGVAAVWLKNFLISAEKPGLFNTLRDGSINCSPK